MSNPMIMFSTFALVALSAILLARPIFMHHVHVYQVRVRPVRDDKRSAAEKPKDSFILNACMFIGQLMLTSLPALADKRAIVLLTFANYRTPDHLAIYTGIRTVMAGGALFLGMLAAATNPINFVLAIPAAVLAWLIPNFFLAARAKQRQNKILKELPIIIDLMIVCAQAGLSMLGGLDKISKEVDDSCPTIAGELRQLINDVKIFAKSVPYALRDMGERCGVDELINMAAALIAAEAKGADISYPLKQQGQALRDRLKRKMEEEAGKVPVKMVPVIMIFIMPLILAPMLGPAVVVIINALEPILKSL